MENESARAAAKVEELRQRFLERCAADLILLCAYPDGVSREQLARLVHRMTGAAATFGYSSLAAAAAELETALGRQIPDAFLPIQPVALALAGAVKG